MERMLPMSRFVMTGMVALAVACTSCAKNEPIVPDGSSPEEATQVRKGFNTYQKAVGESDGEKAARFVTAASLKEYEHIRQLALSGKPDELKKESLAKQMLVLMTRLKVPKEELQKLDGKALYALTIADKWTPPNALMKTKLGKIEFRDGRATAPAILNGKRITYVDQFGISGTREYSFLKEGGVWKFDVVALMDYVTAFTTTVARKSKLDNTSYLNSALARVPGKRYVDDPWKPLD